MGEKKKKRETAEIAFLSQILFLTQSHFLQEKLPDDSFQSQQLLVVGMTEQLEQ